MDVAPKSTRFNIGLVNMCWKRDGVTFLGLRTKRMWKKGVLFDIAHLPFLTQTNMEIHIMRTFRAGTFIQILQLNLDRHMGSRPIQFYMQNMIIMSFLEKITTNKI